MKTVIFIVMTFVATTAIAQTAKVIQLDAENATLAKSLNDQQIALDNKKAELAEKIRFKYLMNDIVLPTVDKAKHYNLPKQGWEGGFEYSEDFKFIVPKQSSSTTLPSCYFTNPAILQSTGVFPEIH